VEIIFHALVALLKTEIVALSVGLRLLPHRVELTSNILLKFFSKQIFLARWVTVTCLIMFEIRNINSNRMKQRTQV